tara:strand:- start:9 stop:551 length:543 start_codon:yes stop_codon:yes gene_type:complete
MSQLKVNSIIPVSGVPTGGGGGIVQTVIGEQRSNVSQSVDGAANGSSSVLSAQITPTSSSSKVKISGTINLGMSNPSNVIYVKLFKNSSVLSAASSSESAGNRQTGTVSVAYVDHSWQMATVSFSFLDSPSTTSQTTYQIFLGHSAGSNMTLYVNRSHNNNDTGDYANTGSFIILEEVSA